MVTGTTIGDEANRSVADNSGLRSQQMAHALQIAQSMLEAGHVPDLNEIALKGAVAGHRYFAGLWALLTFGDVGIAYRAAAAGQYNKTGYVRGTVPLATAEVELEGHLYTEHFYSFSSLRSLSGKKRAYIAGMFELDEDGLRATVEPWVIGDFLSEVMVRPELKYRWPDRSRIYISHFQEFAKVESVRPPSEKQLEVLRVIPQERVKTAFAEIAGEPFAPADPSGEESNVYLNRLKLGSESDDGALPVAAAFAFKGPAKYGPLQPADFGDCGDQLLQLFDARADVMVLQHSHKVKPTVVRQMEALAARLEKPKLYCVVDGSETYRVLKAYGHL